MRIWFIWGLFISLKHFELQFLCEKHFINKVGLIEKPLAPGGQIRNVCFQVCTTFIKPSKLFLPLQNFAPVCVALSDKIKHNSLRFGVVT